jgi:hypothetical protein
MNGISISSHNKHFFLKIFLGPLLNLFLPWHTKLYSFQRMWNKYYCNTYTLYSEYLCFITAHRINDFLKKENWNTYIGIVPMEMNFLLLYYEMSNIKL